MDGLTGVRALREQAAFVIDPDDVRSLPTFFWIAAKAGKATHIYAPPLPAITPPHSNGCTTY